VENSLAQDGATLIEIKIDYNENELRRQKLRELISRVLSADLPESDRKTNPRSEPPSELV